MAYNNSLTDISVQVLKSSFLMLINEMYYPQYMLTATASADMTENNS